MPELPKPQRLQRFFSPAEATFYAGSFVWLGTVALLWMVGWAMARFIPPLKTDPSIAALFVPWARESIAPEPDERRIYIVLTLLSPLLILAAWVGARRFLFPSQRVGIHAFLRWERFPTAAMPAALLMLGLGGGVAYLWRTAPTMGKMFLLAVPGMPWLVCGVLVLWLALTRRARRRSKTKTWSALALAGSLALVLTGGITLRVFDYRTASFAGAVHLNTVLYPIVQSVNGQRTMVDFLPQYGCYAEMLKPCFALIGLSVFHIMLVLTAVQCLGFGAILWTFSRLLRSGWLLLLCAAVLAWLPMWLEATLGRFDPYFQYFPLRVLFPALSFPAAWWYLRRPSARRAVAAGVVGGLAVWWNVDSGAVTLVSLLGLLAIKALVQWGHPLAAGERRAGPHLLAGCGAAALALGGFYLWLCLEARAWVDVGSALRYQSIFYGSGFYMLRMPAAFDPWHLVVGVYLLGLTFGLGHALMRRSLGVGVGMTLYLGVLGLGLFSYYQGRSHPIVLLLCCWPAVLLALMLSDRLLAAVRYGLLPRWCGAGALPVLMLAAACAVCLWEARSYIVKTDRLRWQGVPASELISPVPRQVAYIKRTLPRGASCAIISPYQSLYYAATGLRSALTGQSLFECLLQSDLEDLFRQLKARRVQHLFTETADYPPGQGNPLGPEYFRLLTSLYHLKDVSEDGLMHWVPLADNEMGTDQSGGFRRDFEHLARLTTSPPTVRHAVRFPPSHLLLDLSSQSISAPYNWGKIILGNDWAFEILLNPAATQKAAACVISNHPGKRFDGFTFQQAGGPDQPDLYAMYFGNGHTFTMSELFSLSPGQEHYVAVSCAANHVSIFVDGKALPPVALERAVTTSELPLTVGTWISNNRPFHGQITEVKWHDQSLPPEVILRSEANLTVNGGP